MVAESSAVLAQAAARGQAQAAQGCTEGVPVRRRLRAQRLPSAERLTCSNPGCPAMCAATDVVEVVPSCRAGRRLARSAAHTCPAW